MKHASVRFGEMEIPLIGIPMSSTQERCDGCKREFHLQEIQLQAFGQFYCHPCSLLDCLNAGYVDEMRDTSATKPKHSS